MKLKFYKDEQGWFIDLPEYIEQGGTKGDLAMISGADTLLDKLDRRILNYPHTIYYGPTKVRKQISRPRTVTLDVSRLPQQGYDVLQKIQEDDFGAWYVRITDGHLLWLCPVTLFVFAGAYPPFIYFKNMGNE